MEKKYIFIINPTSGNTNYKILINNIKSYFCDKNYIIEKTKKPLDAMKIAAKYKNDENNVVYSVGGDGTLNEVVNGLAKGKAYLGIIPSGSGNDFYKSVNIYNKEEGKVDLGKVNNRYFINITSIGFDAEVCNVANKLKLKKVRNSYVKGIIKTFFKYKTKKLKININGKKFFEKYVLCAICNGRYYGNGIRIAPLASFDDDKFDVIIAGNMNKFKMLYLFAKLPKGKHLKSKSVKTFKTDGLKISCEEELIVNIDGEIIKSKKLDIKMVIDSLKIYNNKEIVEKVLYNTKN